MSDSVFTLALRVESEAAVRNLDRFADKTRDLGTLARSTAASVAGLFAGSQIARFANDWLKSAADTQETIGKFGAVFGYASKEAQKYADELAKSFNYSTSLSQDKLATMADIFRKSGLSMQDSLKFAFDLNKQAADLEAFTNCAGGLEQTTRALTGAMLGETEMAKTLGVVVYDAYVKEKMAQEARQGLKFATEAAAKTHARYSVIMEQSASATGQVAREADNYSSRLRVLRARSEDLRGSLGEALIEPATQLVTAATLAIEKLNALDSTTRNFWVVGGLVAAGLASLGAAVAPLVGGLAQLVAAKKLATVAAQETAASSGVETGALGTETTAQATVTATVETETAARGAATLATSTGTAAVEAATLALGAETSARGALTVAIEAETAALERNAAARLVAQNVGAQPFGGSGAKSGKKTRAKGGAAGKRGGSKKGGATASGTFGAVDVYDVADTSSFNASSGTKRAFATAKQASGNTRSPKKSAFTSKPNVVPRKKSVAPYDLELGVDSSTGRKSSLIIPGVSDVGGSKLILPTGAEDRATRARGNTYRLATDWQPDNRPIDRAPSFGGYDLAADAPSGGIYDVAEDWTPDSSKKTPKRKRSAVDVYETEDDRRKREERDANDEKKRERKERGAKIKSRREEKRAAKIEWRRGEREKREKFEADDLAAIVEDWRVGRDRKLNPSGPQPTAFQRFLNETFDEAPTNAKAGKIRSTFEARREKTRSERRETHSAWRDMRSGKGPSWIGVDDFSYGRIGKKIAGNRKGDALGKLGGSALGKVGKALTTAFAPVKKFLGPLQKFGAALGGVVTRVLSAVPIVGKFAGILGRFAAFGGPIGAVVGVVAGALEFFRKAPENLEVFLHEGLPILKEFGGKAIEALVAGFKGAVDWAKGAVLGVGSWFTGAILGVGQTFKRLAGFETEATRAYRLNKQIETANEARARLLAAEEAQRAAEIKVLNAQAAARKSKNDAKIGRAAEREDDVVKEAQARATLDQTETDIKKKEGELGQTQKDVQKFGSFVASAEKYLGQLSVEENKVSFDKNLTDEEKQARKAEINAKRKDALGKKEAWAKERDAASERAGTLSTELAALNASWHEQGVALDELQTSISESTRAFEDDQREFAKTREENAKSLETFDLSRRVELAPTAAAKETALKANVDANARAVKEPEDAGAKAQELNEKLKADRARFENKDAADAIAKLKTLAESGDDTSQDGLLAFEAAKLKLQSAGYDYSDATFANGGATRLYEKIIADREAEAKALETTARERDEAQTKANGLEAARGALASSQDALKDFRTERADEKEERRRVDEEREREGSKIDEGLAETSRNDWYDRRLRGATSAEKLSILGEKGAVEAAESQAKMREQLGQINALDAKITALDNLDDAGMLNETQRKERERLRSDRDRLKSEFDEERTSDLQNRIANENERYAAAQTLAEEQTKPLRERLLEQSKVEKEARGPVEGQKAVAAGSSEAFRVASRVWDSGQKNREKTVENIEKYVEELRTKMAEFLTAQSSGFELKMGW